MTPERRKVMKQALIVLDVQRIYTDRRSDLYCKEAGKTVDKINKLIKQMEDLGQSIVLVRHMHKIDGSDIGRLFDYTGEAEEDFNFKEGSEEVAFDNRLLRPNNALEIRKNRYSAFAGTDLEGILKKRDIKKIIICGFMTNFCCESTARDGLDRNFYVDFVMDATGTPGTDNFGQKQIREVVGELLGAGFARVMTTKEILSQLGNA
jgi:nicotinamidase-related amidase